MDLDNKSNVRLSLRRGVMRIYLGHLADTGEEYFLPLSEVCNILIAGHCGSGKSIYIHTMHKKLFAKFGPDSLKILLFDCKRIEFNRMKNDPHLLLPIGHNLQDFKKQLAFLERMLGERTKADPPILFVVDEFADICLEDSEIAKPVEHLMENGPSKGIYLVLSTQMESCYTEKMLEMAGVRISFNQAEVDSLRFIETKETNKLKQGEAVVVSKEKRLVKVRIIYDR